MMVAAGRECGLPICTEVLDTGCLELVAEKADLLQIGSRNMHNTSFLFALGAHPRGRPALLKRGFGATVDEFLAAAEYFLLGRLSAGHRDPGLILCERGLRTFETSTRFTLDIGAIPVLRRRTHLPVLVDPSHPAGDRTLVEALALAGIAAGAHGLLVEVHRDPEHAWCDAAQSLSPAQFTSLMTAIRRIRPPAPVIGGVAPRRSTPVLGQRRRARL
jgi:3-deoxy-7-phosphoheptulonate synthase